MQLVLCSPPQQQPTTIIKKALISRFTMATGEKKRTWKPSSMPMVNMNIFHKKSNTVVDKDREAAWEKMLPESMQKFECTSPLTYHLTTLIARTVEHILTIAFVLIGSKGEQIKFELLVMIVVVAS